MNSVFNNGIVTKLGEIQQILTNLVSNQSSYAEDVSWVKNELIYLRKNADILSSKFDEIISDIHRLEESIAIFSKNETPSIHTTWFEEKKTEETASNLPLSTNREEKLFFSNCTPDGFQNFAMVKGDNITEASPMAKYCLEVTGDEALFSPVVSKVGELSFNASSLLNPVCEVEGQGSSFLTIEDKGRVRRSGNGWKLISKCKITLS